MQSQNVKLIVFVPESHADVIREVVGKAGGGKMGNYDFCSFSTKGVGRFRGNEKSNPSIGEPMKYESVEEEKIEFVVPRDILKQVIEEIKIVHPYEEIAFDILPREEIDL